MEITTRPYSGAADQDAVLDLLRVCRAASRERHWPNVAQLRVSLLGSPTLDPTRDARLWEDAAGPVYGFAMLWRPRNHLVFFGWPASSNGPKMYDTVYRRILIIPSRACCFWSGFLKVNSLLSSGGGSSPKTGPLGVHWIGAGSNWSRS
jgi:hypothetical protein